MYGAGLSTLNVFKLENGKLDNQNIVFSKTGSQGKG